jgi:hypothetical protein
MSAASRPLLENRGRNLLATRKYFAELIAAFAGKVLPKYRTKNQRPSHHQRGSNSNEMADPTAS